MRRVGKGVDCRGVCVYEPYTQGAANFITSTGAHEIFLTCASIVLIARQTCCLGFIWDAATEGHTKID